MKQEVARYFDEHKLSRFADSAMHAKTFVLLSSFALLYSSILFAPVSPVFRLILCACLGIVIAGIGFAVGHDALHGAYSNNPRVNQWLGYTFEILGANTYMWKITHNQVHHRYTNRIGMDDDLTSAPVLRLSPHAPHQGFHRFQHLYAPFLYSLATFFWVIAKDYAYFLRPEIGPLKTRPHPKPELLKLFAFKGFYWIYMIVIPYLVLDMSLGQVALGFLTMHLVAGLIMGLVFQLAHIVEDAEHERIDGPQASTLPGDFARHQLNTSVNFACDNALLTWYVGGLNYQTEHHLFPQVCSTHYPALRPIVQRIARKYGVRYRENPTVWVALKSHFRILKAYGANERAPEGGLDEAHLNPTRV